MVTCILKREYLNDRTVGKLEVYKGTDKVRTFRTLELPYVGNQRNISCIPLGGYSVSMSHSPKFGECYRLAEVPDRDGILIHKGNYTGNTQGCILIGTALVDLDGDLQLDVANTCEAIEQLESICGETFNLFIV